MQGSDGNVWVDDRAYRLYVIDTHTGIIVASVGRLFRRIAKDNYETRGGVVALGHDLHEWMLKNTDFEQIVSHYNLVNGTNNSVVQVDPDHFTAGPKGNQPDGFPLAGDWKRTVDGKVETLKCQRALDRYWKSKTEKDREFCYYRPRVNGLGGEEKHTLIRRVFGDGSGRASCTTSCVSVVARRSDDPFSYTKRIGMDMTLVTVLKHGTSTAVRGVCGVKRVTGFCVWCACTTGGVLDRRAAPLLCGPNMDTATSSFDAASLPPHAYGD